VILRLPFLQEPLDGDEGIYSSIAMWLDHGAVLYKDLVDLKPPLLFYIYLSIFKLFGWSALSLRSFSLFYSLIGTIMIFFIGRRLLNERSGLSAALLFAVFSGGPMIEGAGANAEVFMILPMMLALLFFLRNEYLLAGLLSGLAIMIKQVALYNFLALIGFNLWPVLKDRRQWLDALKINGRLIVGFMVVPALFLVYFAFKGALNDLIEATILVGVRNIKPNLLFFLARTVYIALLENSLLWLLAIAAIVHIWLTKSSRQLKYLTIWAGFSLLGVFTGGYAFGHYYIQIIPALCLLSGVALVSWQELGSSTFFRRILIIGLVILVAMIVFVEYKYYLVYSPAEISMAKYGSPLNVVAQRIGLKIKERTGPDDLVFPRLLYQIPLYAGRLSASKCYQSLGGQYQVVGSGGEVIYQHDFSVRQRQSLLQKQTADFEQALNNPRTKYFIYLKDQAPPGFSRRLIKTGYVPDQELSEPAAGVLVYKRIY
jgi:4-amino-4-deoxy-L-arabinose transferase-like glycosyltransferase